MRLLFYLGILAMIAVALMTRPSKQTSPSGAADRTHIVLIGASIGRSWQLAAWPDRMHQPAFTIESVAAWQFDKSDALEEVLMRPKRKFRPTRTYLRSLLEPPPQLPAIVILKECSSYFPGNLDGYLASMRTWVQRLRQARIQTVLATVAPVTRARSGRDPGKQSALIEFNRRIREYASQEGLPLLDLESVLRAEGSGSFLRDEFTSGDGSHLNATAYRHLDGELRTVLSAMVGKGKGDR
ncbi:MAG: hypothetical protein JNL62_08845 [Bryobacterales bacterium]|nr:hypothetical protein [Bryobacterales bacterium]